MANIDNYINKFRNAIYGEEVRSALIALSQAVNTQAEDAATTASGFSSRISSLESDNTKNKTDISQNQEKIGNLEKADTAQDSKIATLENEVKEAKPKIQKALDDNASQDEKIKKLESDTASHKENLTDIYQQLDDNAKTNRSHNDRISALESTNRITESTLADMATRVSETEDAAASAYDSVKEFEGRMESVEGRMQDFIDDFDVIDGYLYGLNNGVQRVGPYGPFSGGGGSGGSSGNNATITVQNTSGYTSKVIASGASCLFTGLFTSIEDGVAVGDGAVTILVNGAVVGTRNIPQGSFEIDLAPYLSMGQNNVRIQVQDVYGNQKTLAVSVKVIVLTLTSTFDNSGIFDGSISFVYTPTGAVTKTVKFLVDGALHGTQTVTSSDRQQTYHIPQQRHGSHTLECYFTAVIDGQEVESNHLFYDLVCIKPGDYTPIVAIDFNEKSVSQYANMVIPYTVYNPESLTAEVSLEVNGNVVNTVTVDRSRQVWAYRANQPGQLSLTVRCGEVSKTVIVTVTEVDIDAEAETADLKLYLTSTGRSNGEENPASWISQGTPDKWSVKLNGFNWKSNGWMSDEDGVPVLRCNGGATGETDYKPFATDCRTTGKTIEFEFATRDVRDYDAEIISCMSGGIGLKITAQEARLKSAQSEIVMQFKDDEHLRVSFVIEKRNETRLAYIYVDGIRSKVIQYPANDDFAQTTPVPITWGHPDCGLDLYNIRCYDNNLTMHQMLDNWIADTQNGALMLERYARNAVYDEYGQVVIANLPKDLPYMILQAPELPQSKGDKKTVSGQYVDPTNSAKSFRFEDASFDVQGTSSQHYARKNYKGKFKGFITNSGISEKYALRPGAIPVSTFCFKADVASSEGVNNVELVRLYNEACPYKTPPQKENSAVRQGIDGFPIVIFWNDGDRTTFLGKYNFNNDKGTEAVYGFQDGDESWETLNNTSDRALFKAWKDDVWTEDFEGRYPDGNENTDKLKALIQTVSGWKNPTAAQLEAVANKQSAVFYYLFTELFLMVDSRAKNAFPSFFDGDSGKVCWLPYDFDTGIGTNNEGQLVFNYNLETGDKVGTADVFNGEGHAFWAAVKEVWKDDIAKMYADLRASGALSFAKTRQMFDDHQSKWPEAIFNEDGQYKYIDPLINSSDAMYLTMMQGSKKSQRDWWLYHRFRYMDSKYCVADNLTEVITVRGYAKADLTVTPYSDTYVNVKYGSYLVQKRGTRNVPYLMECPLDNVNDTETYFHGAGDIKKIEGLPAYQVGYANFTYGVKLVEIVLGSAASGYTNDRLTELHLGQLKLLKLIDCRNCIKLGTGQMAAVDASGCTNLEEVYMDNTAITGMDLPNGGQLRKLHLPATITNLTILNQQKLEEVVIPDYSNISTLRIENINNVLDPINLLDHIAANARVRLIGFDLGTVTVESLTAFMDKLDAFRGLDENGNNMDTAQVSGHAHISALTGAEMQIFKERYPYINVTYDHITSYLSYYSEDGSTLLHKETILDGADGTWTGTASKASTAQYTYAFDGWARTPGGTLWADAKVAVAADRSIYAHFTANLRYYTVYFYNGSTLLQTVSNVPYGGSASYSGSTGDLVDPSGSGQPFTYWSPAPTNIQGNTSCYAQYKSPREEAEITDSLTVFLANIKNGTYKTKYMVGNYLPIDMGDEGTLNIQIAGFDKDPLSDGSGNKAPVTMVFKEILKDSHRMNPSRSSTTDEDGNTVYTMGTGTIGGWEHSEMRSYLQETIWPKLPEELRNAICEVQKTTTAYDTAGQSFQQTVNDKIWIPDYKEVFNSSAAVNYTTLFDSAENRKKYKAGASSAYYWWLRYAFGTNYFYYVYSHGGNSNHYATNSFGVVPGFCLNP